MVSEPRVRARSARVRREVPLQTMRMSVRFRGGLRAVKQGGTTRVYSRPYVCKGGFFVGIRPLLKYYFWRKQA